MKFKTIQGFTLIEIMVALAIVSIAVLAIANAMNQNAVVLSELEKRLLASWVANNQMELIRYDSRVNRIKEGSKSKVEKMAGLRWRVLSKIEESDVSNVYMLSITVNGDAQSDKAPYASLTTALVK